VSESYELKEALKKAMIDRVRPETDPIQILELRALLYVVQTLDEIESRLDRLDHSVASLDH